MRRTPFTADQMHSFLKDKQAWENAIAMYQGPDPLDHWYNYICWYENNSHGDPENKFRETLERCLTLYEHSDYYKLDPRMVRLWVKYIDMQQNPLHFYQILYQRGVGRQCAVFYINWARYYESINAIKEAESVFNLAFQEKAQPYVELQNAHSKLLYARNNAVVVAHTVQEEKLPPSQPQLPQQQHVIHKVQHQQQHIHYQHPQQQQLQMPHAHQLQHQANPQPHHHHQPQQHQIYQQHVNYQVQHPLHSQQQHAQHSQPQQIHYHQHTSQHALQQHQQTQHIQYHTQLQQQHGHPQQQQQYVANEVRSSKAQN